MERISLEKFIEKLASQGQHHFITGDAVNALCTTPIAVRAALRRSRQKGRIAAPFRGFHIIVPPEYKSLGCLPAEQFVPQLLDHLGQPYYAGLLSAAQFHGAAHQKHQEFQVVVRTNRPEIRCGHVRVRFVARRNAADVTTEMVNTARGTLRVSSPEATAFDLVGYPHHCGGLSNMATVLGELAERLRPDRLLQESVHSPLPWAQRLGFLLERVGAVELSKALSARVRAEADEYVPLRVGRAASAAPRDKRWRILVNENVEPDL
ncbi:MAG: type IV toxin-antitoxin system AbiEi family antitoxin [Spirochaetes bacterium]|nr:type IV toxin-antitoxin system AbiEi family antitoxin [Spirochaetota bacterium]